MRLTFGRDGRTIARMGLIGTIQDLLHARKLLDVEGAAPSPVTGPDDRHGVVAPGPVVRIRPVVDRTDSPEWCVCGQPATTPVRVHWQDGARRYRYCDECAHDIVWAIEGAEILP